jgi:hypothetical protein
MSSRVEWLKAREVPACALTGADAAEFSDAFGSRLDAGNEGLFVGGSDGAIVEGSHQELVEWLLAGLASLSGLTAEGLTILSACLDEVGRHLGTSGGRAAADIAADVIQKLSRDYLGGE